MEVFIYSVFVLFVTILVFYLPALILYFSHLIKKEILSKKYVYTNIFCFLFLYLAFCMLGICAYYFFSDFGGTSSSTATRTDIVYIFTAVATLFAPLILVYTFDSWKKQSLEQSKIQAIGQIKELLSRQHKTISLFLIRNRLDDLFFSNKNYISNEMEELSEEIENLRWETLGVIQKNYFYFEKSEFDKLIEMNNSVYCIIQSLEQALNQIQLEKVVDKLQFYKNIYLIDPDSHFLKAYVKIDNTLLVEYKKYAVEKIHSILDEYDEFLNDILDGIYKK